MPDGVAAVHVGAAGGGRCRAHHPGHAARARDRSRARSVTREATGQGHGLVRSAAWVVAAGALLSGPVAMLIVSITHPQPAWSGPETFRANYHPIQTIPY